MSEWRRRERLVDEMRLAEGLKVGILVRKFFEVVIEFDSAPDISLGGGQIPPLGSVATEVKLDEGIFGMKVGGIGKNF